MSLKKWIFHAASPERSEEISERFGVNNIIADILATRGFQDEEIEEYFGQGELESPFVLKDMDLAVERLNQALENQEKIVVYGDYDCDGITSTYILYTYLLSIGAEVEAFIPERNVGGYGLNQEAIDQFHEQGVQLLVTVDNGISALKEADYIAELGMDLIITDHHAVGDTLPQAVAVINPHRSDCPSKFKDLAGVGVAFKLIVAMEEGDYQSALQFAGEFVAIGTIGDIVPLVGENRTLVQEGLRLLEFSENLGLNKLFQKAKIPRSNVLATVIAFGIVPRINAAGRFNMANKVFELFTSEDKETIDTISTELNELNTKRQQLEQGVIQEIMQQIAENPNCLHDRVLVFAKEGWPKGILGIVSARITERYGKPSVVMEIDGEYATGSARSIDGFSLYQTMYANRDLCVKWGGHSKAAGITIATKDLEAFRKGLNLYAKNHLKRMPDSSYKIDRVVTLKELTVENVESLSVLEPFGCENPSPLFLMKNVRLEEVIPLAGGKHLKLKFFAGTGMMQALLFGVPRSRFYFKRGTMLNLVVSLDINNFNGRKSVSVKIKDMRPCSFEQYRFFSAKWAFEDIMRGEVEDPKIKARALPNRNEIAAIYRTLHNLKKFEGNAEKLYLLTLKSGMNYCKLSIIIEILKEQGLLEMVEDGKTMVMKEATAKVNLSESKILAQLK